MPPLFSSTEFWTSLIVALIGGGGVGAIIGAISGRRKDTADIAAKACDILTDSVIKPLREQVESQEEQIQHLEVQQRKYFALTAYTRSLFHWLQQFCEIVEPDFLQRHPKPHLPDELRADVAPETVEDSWPSSSPGSVSPRSSCFSTVAPTCDAAITHETSRESVGFPVSRERK